MELVIFVGLQGSGKSTFYRQRFVDSHIRLNLDMLRTRRRESILLQACLEAKQPLVIDNTNPTPADRAGYIAAAKAARFRVIGYFFEVNLEECKRRNQTRSGKSLIPIQGLLATQARLIRPTLDEGFDELWQVRCPAGGEWSVQRT